MSKILAFAGSNSSTSINQELLQYVQKTYTLSEMKIISLRSLDIPMFGVDAEKENGYPKAISDLSKQIVEASKLVIATPEHNGNMTSYLKSTMDWLSRLDKEILKEKQVFILGTSPGRGGALGSIENLKKLVLRLGGEVKAEFSLPSYGHSFENGKMIAEHSIKLDEFISKLK